jgi:F-type H+-transporting ATPase subunit b
MRACRVLLLAFLVLCGTHKAGASDPAQSSGNSVPAIVATGHGAEATGTEAASAEHEEEQGTSFSDINWYYGLIGEKDHVEPSILWRPTGMPAPFLATGLNWLILMSLIVVFARKQLPAALKKRKATIVSGMEEAGRIKNQAENRLNELEEKLSHVDEEIELIKAEMQRASELERERILREAEERRIRIERDAARLIETELEGAKDQLRRDVVATALEQASQEVARQLTGQDQQSLFDEAIGSLKNLPSNSLGGRA